MNQAENKAPEIPVEYRLATLRFVASELPIFQTATAWLAFDRAGAGTAMWVILSVLLASWWVMAAREAFTVIYTDSRDEEASVCDE